MLRTVIVVEDDLDLAVMQAEILRDYAQTQIIHDDFNRVFLPATWIGVDVAIVDLMLPGLEGEDICRFLMDEFPMVRRIICTAKPTYVLPGLQMLADVVLQKPFDERALIAAVTQ